MITIRKWVLDINKNCKYKQGEQEAKDIMQNLFGIFLQHNDDNSQNHMPDFKISDDYYFEVTHTHHNYDDKPTKYERNLTLEQFCNDANRLSEAINRYISPKGCYDNNKDLLHKDIELIKEFYGGENKVNHRTYCFDEKNISDVIKEKSLKYKGLKNIDLFVFVPDAEMKCVFRNGYNSIQKAIINSPFQKVYLCRFEFLKGFPKCRYNTINPTILLFEDSNVLKYNTK